MPDGQFPGVAADDFDLLAFLTGSLSGWGIFEDRFGRLKERFEISAVGRWDGDALVLEEHFTYASGRTEDRVWTLKAGADGAFTGRCDDCRGEAVGRISNGVANLNYTFLLRTKQRTIGLKFSDRFYPVGHDGVMNRTSVSKWGLKVGEVSAFFRRDD